MIMSRLSIYVYVLLACASLDVAFGMGRAASATEECSQRYKGCNWSCDQPIAGVDRVQACKNGCDLHLIACDRQPVNTTAQRGGYSPRALPRRDDGGAASLYDTSD
jgi:hypothetical protein